MKKESANRAAFTIPSLMGPVAAIYFLLTMSSMGLELYETIPDLTVKAAGLVPAGGNPGTDSKDFKDIVTADPSPKGALEFWVWLQGDDKALDYLRKHPGTLPLKQEVYIPTMFGPNFIPVGVVGTAITSQPGWSARYVQILADELKSKGLFITSDLSRYTPGRSAMQYEVRFRTADGKLLRRADGHLIVATIQAPH